MFSEGLALKNWICSWLVFKVLWLRGDDASQAKLDGRLFSTVTLLSTCLDKTVFWVFCQQTTKTRQTNDQKQRRKKRKLSRISNLDFDQKKRSKIGVQISILQFGRQCLKCCSRFERSQCLQFHWNVFAKTSHWVQFSPPALLLGNILKDDIRPKSFPRKGTNLKTSVKICKSNICSKLFLWTLWEAQYSNNNTVKTCSSIVQNILSRRKTIRIV